MTKLIKIHQSDLAKYRKRYKKRSESWDLESKKRLALALLLLKGRHSDKNLSAELQVAKDINLATDNLKETADLLKKLNRIIQAISLELPEDEEISRPKKKKTEKPNLPKELSPPPLPTTPSPELKDAMKALKSLNDDFQDLNSSARLSPKNQQKLADETKQDIVRTLRTLKVVEKQTEQLEKVVPTAQRSELKAIRNIDLSEAIKELHEYQKIIDDFEILPPKELKKLVQKQPVEEKSQPQKAEITKTTIIPVKAKSREVSPARPIPKRTSKGLCQDELQQLWQYYANINIAFNQSDKLDSMGSYQNWKKLCREIVPSLQGIKKIIDNTDLFVNLNKNDKVWKAYYQQLNLHLNLINHCDKIKIPFDQKEFYRIFVQGQDFKEYFTCKGQVPNCLFNYLLIINEECG